MLHTLMNSPSYSDFNTLLLMINIEDDILLLQDAVIGAIQGNLIIEKILETNKSIMIWVLEEDLVARGLIKQISTKVNLVNYNGFVKLTEKHQQQILW
ncbi:sulfurtransferase complex subunit TusB [Candidatus Pantoea edessiphila]|uniref:Sulfurtransferase complex subunit TusB n=1 Tax=Candidatus Pantoea edessiphila TaxID=2044610 RepID=A0A2P5SZU9_9GAMM|nr:sulfurtransferase complex subunit TusB [Candidatus Pantoea edessiphila]PPI87855.1 sulfurtransferase complex subunit TusB [Candidatus Pantoea edessiphila]